MPLAQQARYPKNVGVIGVPVSHTLGQHFSKNLLSDELKFELVPLLPALQVINFILFYLAADQ